MAKYNGVMWLPTFNQRLHDMFVGPQAGKRRHGHAVVKLG